MASAFYDEQKCILVTGAAGFIGYHLIQRLVKEDNWFIIGTDSINDYYDVNFKYARLAEWGIEREEIRYNRLVPSRTIEKASFIQLNLEDTENVMNVVRTYDIKVVCHLGTQDGVRNSLETQRTYVDSNVAGFTNVLEACRMKQVEHLVYACSSSVYGMNERIPMSTYSPVDHQDGFDFDAATRKPNELMAHVYSQLYGLPTTGLRFLTVYGPWGRPDMLPMLFVDAIMNDKPINVFNNEDMGVDFTYIDDVVEGIMRVIRRPPVKLEADSAKPLDPSFSTAPYRVYNIGRSSSVRLGDYIMALEKESGKKAIINHLPMQTGEVLNTYYCDSSDLESEFGFRPTTTLDEGLKAFVNWYNDFLTGDKPLINQPKIVVGPYPFPAILHWKYIWAKHVPKDLAWPDHKDELLDCLIKCDGYDCGLGLIGPEAWKAYLERLSSVCGLKKNDSVFEVGCGSGALLFPLFEQGYRVAGIDYSAALIHMAKSAMPDGLFEWKEASMLDENPQFDVVMANSVFQYFRSLDYAAVVLRKMFNKANRAVMVLNVPCAETREQELEASKMALPDENYELKYSGLTHLYFRKYWFQEIAGQNSWKVTFFDQEINGYGCNSFRFNCLFTRKKLEK